MHSPRISSPQADICRALSGPDTVSFALSSSSPWAEYIMVSELPLVEQFYCLLVPQFNCGSSKKYIIFPPDDPKVVVDTEYRANISISFHISGLISPEQMEGYKNPPPSTSPRDFFLSSSTPLYLSILSIPTFLVLKLLFCLCAFVPLPFYLYPLFIQTSFAKPSTWLTIQGSLPLLWIGPWEI